MFAGADIVVIWAPGGADRPYKCPTSFKEKSPSAYYIRKAANTTKANSRDERDIFELAENAPFDYRPNMTASVDDLKASLISEFLRSVNSELYESSLT